MAKQVKVLHTEERLMFPFPDYREVVVSEDMAIEDAEVIAAQYPGLFVDVIETEEQPETEAKVAKPKKADKAE